VSAAVVELLMKLVEGEHVVSLQIKVLVGVTYGNTDKLLLGLALIHCARALHDVFYGNKNRTWRGFGATKILAALNR